MGLVYEEQGYQKIYDFSYGWLEELKEQSFYGSLNKGWSYKIMAVCDTDCDDIDLCVYDDLENQIGCDVEDDAYPIVGVNVSRTCQFTFKVTMYDCSIEPCKIGVAVYGKKG